MSLPPKSDNDDVLPEAGETKPRARKTTRAAAGVKRVRTRKTKADKAESEDVSRQSPDTGDLFSGNASSEAPAPAPEPVRRSRAESAPAEVRHEAPAPSPEQSAPRQERQEQPSREVRQPAPEAPRSESRPEPAP